MRIIQEYLQSKVIDHNFRCSLSITETLHLIDLCLLIEIISLFFNTKVASSIGVYHRPSK